MPLKLRDSHIRRPNNRFMGDSVFTNRMPTIIRDNKTLIGTRSVLFADRMPTSNSKVKSTRGYLGSMFGIFGGSKKPTKK